ncbi:MAG: hypothetical protein PHX51_07085 [Clostridia bacterium]|nr:hypothetical protein [Clostridia bacterium]
MLELIDIEKEKRRRHKEQLKQYKSRNEYYQTHPLEWMTDRLEIRPETIDWTLLPEYFNHEWDGTPNPLKQVLDALVNNEWAGVESATACSKTFLAAAITLWFLDVFENSLVVTTAPKEAQLTLNIWKEIGSLYKKFQRGYLDTLALRMSKSEEGKKEYKWAAIGFVAGTKSDKETEDKAQGFHAEHMLIILEETPGIPRSIINSFKLTSQAPHNLILALGNPNHHLDELHKFCKLPRVRHIRISGYDFPNIVLDNPGFIPGGKSRQGIKDILDDVGSKEAPRFLSRVRGISPAQSIDSLIAVQWCYEAVEREDYEVEKGLYALGVDVADSETGDQAALAFGKGAILFHVNAFKCPDANQLGKTKVKEHIIDYRIDPKYVGVDGVGVGAGTINALKELGYHVSNLKGGAAAEKVPKDAYAFQNLRSQMWWTMREDLKNGRICLPNDEELIADLCAPTYKDNDKNIIVESKDDIKKRLGRSPNKGDAAVYWNWVRSGRKKSKLKSSLINY